MPHVPGTTFRSAASLEPAYRAVDWEQTPLGPPQLWPSELRTALALVLETRFPAALLWGPELVALYNEAFVALIGDKHPAALGAPAQVVFSEVWETLGPQLRGVLDGGRATWLQDAYMPLERAAGVQDAWFTSSHSPVRDETGAVRGVLELAVETSAQVLGLRRLEALRTLDASLASAVDAADVAERTRVAREDGDADLAPSSGAVSAVVDQFHLLVEAAAAAATARVDARAARRRSEARTQGVLESMPTAFCALDRTWRCTQVNARAEQLLGRPRDELVGERLWDLFPAAADGASAAAFQRAMDEGATAVFEEHVPAPVDAWFELTVQGRDDGVDVYFTDISAYRRAQEQAERDARRAGLREAVSAAVAGADGVVDALERLPALLVPALADWAVATAVDDAAGERSARHDWRDALRDVASAHRGSAADRERTEQFRALRLDALVDPPFSPSGVPAPGRLQTGAGAPSAAQLAPGRARELFEELAPEAVLVQPLRGRDGVLGVLTLFRGAGSPPFGTDDLELLAELAEQAGVALDNARLHAQQRDLAHELQASLLTSLPEPDHLQVVARYRPAARGAQVGGDWYDAYVTDDGCTHLVVGDVAGHDRSAAVVMAQVRNVLRGVAQALAAPPATVLSALDRAVQRLAVDGLTTAVVARVEQSAAEAARGQRVLRWSSAGHPPPLLITRDGRARLLQAPADLLLGLDPDAERHDHTAVLEPGSTVLLYTDGLVERRGEDLDAGLERLREAAARLAAASRTSDVESLCDALLAELAADAEDDVVLLGLRAHPQDRPRPVSAGEEALPPDLDVPGDAAPGAYQPDLELRQLVLAPAPVSASRARAFVRAWCARAGVEEDACEAAVLLTSEVVTNAFLHGRSEARLSVTGGLVEGSPTVHVEVGDENSRRPTRLRTGTAELDGRGLGIVEACSLAWGVVDAPVGKVVWFDVAR